jgi:hypothetical protein
MGGTANGMSHVYKEERIFVGCEVISCFALSLRFFYPVPDSARLIDCKNNSLPPQKGINHLFQLLGNLVLYCFVKPLLLGS